MKIFEHLPVEVKATVVRIYDKKTKENFHLFSVFELLEKGMDVPKNIVVPAHGSDVDNKKVYFSVSDFTMTENFINDPLNNFIIPDYKGNPDKFLFFNKDFLPLPAVGSDDNSGGVKTRGHKVKKSALSDLPCDSAIKDNKNGKEEAEACYVPMNSTRYSALRDILPNPGYVCRVRAYMDAKEETFGFLKDNPALLKQLSEVSLNNMGFDLTEYKEYIGGIILIGYHPQIRRFHIRAVEKPQPGIMLDVELHSNVPSPPLRVDVTLIEQGDCIRAEESEALASPCVSQFIPLPSFPNQPVFKIFDTHKDKDGDKDRLIFYSKDTFLAGGTLTFLVPKGIISGLKAEKPDGTSIKLPDIQKDEREINNFGGRNDGGANYLAERVLERRDRKLKAERSFVFFNGEKNRRQEQQEEAREYVRNLLNRAVRRCYVCDDYFDAKDFGEYIAKLKHDDVEVRILSGYNEMGEKCAKRLADISDNYNKAVGRKITSCRMLMGKSSVLHDRFIIVDDDIWAVGASFNELGKRASVIYKIPQGVDKVIIDEVEKWWNDDTVSRDVHDFPATRERCFRRILNRLNTCFKNIKRWVIRCLTGKIS